MEILLVISNYWFLSYDCPTFWACEENVVTVYAMDWQ